MLNSLTIRNFFFKIISCVWGIVIPIVYCLSFINKNSALADKGAKNWTKFSIWLLEKLCGISYEIRGLNNLPKETPFVVACKHQSMWETMIFHLIFHRPVYSWKKELLRIPFYGWFIKRMSGITIDRKGGASALKSLLRQAKNYSDKKQIIIIFPQGTRTPIGSSSKDYPYQPGITAIYQNLKIDVVPAALNSGVFWAKNGAKKPGKIILQFLPKISPGLDKKAFLNKLENEIEQNTKILLG